MCSSDLLIFFLGPSFPFDRLFRIQDDTCAGFIAGNDAWNKNSWFVSPLFGIFLTFPGPHSQRRCFLVVLRSDGPNGAIDKIMFFDKLLTGTIPPFSLTPYLRHLDLEQNGLTGTIPELTALLDLEIL